MNDVISFAKILEMGVRKLAASGNGLITNGSSLETAFAIGVVEFKKRVQKRRSAIPNGLSDKLLGDIAQRAFPQQVTQDKETKSFEITLAPTEKLPQHYAGYELHIFHDGSTDAHKILMQYVRHLWFQLSPTGYATLELIGDLDPRIPAAQLNFYSAANKPLLFEIIQRFQGIITQEHTGYAIEYLYPKPLENNTYLSQMGDLAQIRQEVFKSIWVTLFEARVFYWEDFAVNFNQHMINIQMRLAKFSKQF